MKSFEIIRPENNKPSRPYNRYVNKDSTNNSIKKAEFTVLKDMDPASVEGARHEYRLSTIFGYFLKNTIVENNIDEPLQVNNIKEKNREDHKKSTIIEAFTPGITSNTNNKSKTLIKRQGTSARLLRSRGFIS